MKKQSNKKKKKTRHGAVVKFKNTIWNSFPVACFWSLAQAAQTWKRCLFNSKVSSAASQRRPFILPVADRNETGITSHALRRLVTLCLWKAIQCQGSPAHLQMSHPFSLTALQEPRVGFSSLVLTPVSLLAKLLGMLCHFNTSSLETFSLW